MSVKQITVIMALVIAIILAIVVAKQMSAEAMAVVIGVICGVAAGIPTAALMLLALGRNDRRRIDFLEQQSAYAQQSSPPVVVIQGGAPQALPAGSQAGYWPTAMPGPTIDRRFHMVGGDEFQLEDARY